LNEYSLVLDKLGRTKEAFAIANQAYDLAKKIEYPFYSGESAANLAQHIAKQEDFELAYQYMLESHAISNEVTMQRANRNVSDLTERYKQESKQKQIDKLQNEAERREVEIQKNELQRRLLWTILAASSIVILLSGYFIWRLRRSNMMLGQLNRNVQLSQSKLQAVVDALPDALFVLDRKGTFLEVHSAIFEKSLGVGLGELKGQNISVLLPEQVVNSLISKLQYLEDSSVPLIEEISLALTDGEHWLELSVVRANWMTDGHEQFVVLARDITDRKQIEVIKQQTEQQFRTLVEHSPDPVIRYDNVGRRVYMNDAFSQHVGLSSIDMLGKLVGDQLQDKLEQAELVHYKSVINQVIKTGTEHRILLSGRFMDEQLHYADIRLCPEFDVAGQVQSVLTLWRDVTELKQAEQKIEQAYGELRRLAERREEEIEEERKRIARDIHDELGQYLTGLKMRISILRMQPDISQQQLSAQISTMLTMLNDTISVVRKLASQIRPVQLSVGINAAIESLVGDLIKETKLICSFESDCSDDEIDEAISIVLFRLLQESLTNIRRHANAKTVDIELRQNQQGYQLKISDDGTGFDTRQNKEGHFGLLGMRERVNNLNGTMTLESILGQGTTITVSIPNPTKAIEDD
jgi:PAS domain S-box-containing protein